MSSAVDGQQQQQHQLLVGDPPPLSVVLQHTPLECKQESPDVSPQHPQSVHMSPTAVQDMPPESTSPVMLATMQPVSVDEFSAADYHQSHHHQQQQQHHHQHQHQHQQQDDPLDQKTVIYIPGTDPQQTIIYDPQNPEGSLPPGITIQQDEANGSAVSVLVQGQAGHQYLGAPGTTVLVMQELVDDMGHIIHRLVFARTVSRLHGGYSGPLDRLSKSCTYYTTHWC